MQKEGTCSVDFLFDIGCLLVKISSLSAFAGFIALDTLDVGSGWVIPSLGKFIVGGGLFEELDGFFSTFGFVAHDIAKERTWLYPTIPFNFLLAYFIIWSPLIE